MPEIEKIRLVAALTAITKPKGVYSRDPLQYRNNVIAWCMKRAELALAGLPDEDIEEAADA